MSHRRFPALCLVPLLLAAVPARAQRVLGVGDDAATLRAGTLRVTLGVLWERANERFDASGKLYGLGAAASTTAWNGAYDARLAAANPLVASLAGLPTFDASLGALAIGRRDASVDGPLGVEVGLTSRITLGARVRVANHAIEPSLRINPGRVEGTMGFNPAWANTTARDRNALLVTQFDSATAQLNRRISQCQVAPAGSGCAPIVANIADARALVTSAGAFATALSQLYGGRGAAGLPFVPVSNSAAQLAINERILGYRDRFSALGSGALGTPGPVGGAQFSSANVEQLLADSLYGFRLRPLRAVKAYSIGEIAVHAKVKLYQSFAEDTTTIRGFAVRQSVGGSVRLSGGDAPLADEFFAPTTGEGSSGFAVQSFTDLFYNERWSTTVVLGFDKGQATDYAMRLPSAAAPSVGGVPFPLVSEAREVMLSRTPGSRLDIAVTPRVSLTRNLWIGATWAYAQQSADQWSVSKVPAGLTTAGADAQAWAAGTDWTEHRVGLGGTYSTLDAVRRGKVRLAFDLTYQHLETTVGTGWRVPKATRDVVSVRWYPRVWGR